MCHKTLGCALKLLPGGGADALASLSPLMTASKLRAPGDEEQEKFLQEVYVTEASTGGNGIRRPYGLFIAKRNGNGKSLWTRLLLATGTGGSSVATKPVLRNPCCEALAAKPLLRSPC